MTLILNISFGLNPKYSRTLNSLFQRKKVNLYSIWSFQLFKGVLDIFLSLLKVFAVIQMAWYRPIIPKHLLSAGWIPICFYAVLRNIIFRMINLLMVSPKRFIRSIIVSFQPIPTMLVVAKNPNLAVIYGNFGPVWNMMRDTARYFCHFCS